MIFPAVPNKGDKVICWYTGFTLQTLLSSFLTGRGSSIGSVFAWHASCPGFDPHFRHILLWRLGHENIFIMQLLENLPCNIGLIMRSGIIPAWHCSCVSVISQCLLKLYHRLIGCTVMFHVISTFHWLNDVTVGRKRAWRDVKKVQIKRPLIPCF